MALRASEARSGPFVAERREATRSIVRRPAATGVPAGFQVPLDGGSVTLDGAEAPRTQAGSRAPDPGTGRMNFRDAVELIRPAVGGTGGTWADLGAGSGLFSRALAEILGPGGRVLAVDRDRQALRALSRRDRLPSRRAGIDVVVGDFREPGAIPDLQEVVLDGALFANALHFVRDAGAVLGGLSGYLRPGADIVVVEYDLHIASAWVPHPLSMARLGEVAARAGFGMPEEVGRRASAYHGEIYCAVLPG